MKRLAIVVSHPIQYYVPWFRFLALGGEIELRVFFLWSTGEEGMQDKDFKQTIKWDLDLLEGYEWEQVLNISKDPGTHHYRGLHNPGLVEAVAAFSPQAILLYGYNYKSHQSVIRCRRLKSVMKLFRGDSHLLVPGKGLKAWLKRILLGRMFKKFSAVLYVGKANREYFETYGVVEEKLFFAPHAVDNDRFIYSADKAERDAKDWRRDLGIEEGEFVFLFAGKFNAKKRPLDLLRAFLGLDHSAAHLVFAGAGELEGELKSGADGCNRIHFLPFQNQTKMSAVYALGDILVLPSYGSGETWGLCINEAFCMKRPAIVSDHVGCQRDLVVDGLTGRVFPAGNVEALAKCLQDCLEDPSAVRKWGENAYRRIQSYSYKEATEGLLQALNSIVKRT